MNRITQCLHGKGTVSAVMKHRDGDVPARYLAFSGMRRPVVFWNLTDRCNLSCMHCYSRSSPDSPTQGELSTLEALAFIDDMAADRHTACHLHRRGTARPSRHLADCRTLPGSGDKNRAEHQRDTYFRRGGGKDQGLRDRIRGDLARWRNRTNSRPVPELAGSIRAGNCCFCPVPKRPASGAVCE